jgi:hypothetical protein
VNLSNPLMIAINRLSHLIPTFLVTIGCVLYLIKSRKLVGVVLLIGNLLTIIINITSAVLIAIANGKMSSEIYSRYSMELQAGSILAGLIFGVGFLIMMIDMERKKDTLEPGAS